MKDPSSLSSLSDPAALRVFLGRQGTGADIYQVLQSLVEAGYGDLPRPGSSRTLRRWQMLAAAAQFDLSLAKLYESHADALAILHELGHADLSMRGGIWGVWCAEPPSHRVQACPRDSGGKSVRLHGAKAWCSGASHVTQALVSAWNDQGHSCLVALDLDQPEIEIVHEAWGAVGMAATASVDIVFHGAAGTLVGAPGAYLDRPGFYHGAAGVAACWYGAASAIAQRVLDSVRSHQDAPHSLAHLGALDLVLTQARHQLRIAAAEIDANPGESCQQAVRRARLAAESAAETILIRAPRAFGPGPMCQDVRIARLLADLPVFIRQSHAERDLQTHGQALAEQATEALWTL
ncbi:MAG TPA: acyl-CoA dehydrogenase family protein [Bordetella sp.]